MPTLTAPSTRPVAAPPAAAITPPLAGATVVVRSPLPTPALARLLERAVAGWAFRLDAIEPDADGWACRFGAAHPDLRIGFRLVVELQARITPIADIVRVERLDAGALPA